MPNSTPQSVLSPTPVAGAPAGPDATEALAHLAKMSGTGSAFGATDYVAISPVAIVALLFGFASALSLAVSLFLFIPVVGILLGLLSLRQIRNSNGTQAGIGFAIGGIALSLLIGGGVVTRQAMAAARTRADSDQCAQVLSRFGNEIKAQHYDAIYNNMTTEGFRSMVNLKAFRETMEDIRANPFRGELQGIHWAGNAIDFEPVAGTDARYAFAMMYFQFKNVPEPSRETCQLTDREGGWKIEGLPQMFRDPKTVPASRR